MLRHLTLDALWLTVLGAVLALQVWSPGTGPGQVHDTYSVEVGGRRAVFELAENHFSSVRRSHVPLTRAVQLTDPEDEAFCILGPARYPTKPEWEALLGWVARGGRLLVTARRELNDEGFQVPGIDAKVKVGSDFDLPGVPGPKGQVAAPPPKKSAGVKSRLLRLKPSIRWLSYGEVVVPQGGEVLVESDGGDQAVRIRYGRGWLVLLASDYVFTNHSLNEKDSINPYLAYRLLKTVGGERGVVFDEYLNWAARPTIEGLLMDEPLRPVTLQLAAILVVFAWTGTHRFGGLLAQTTKPRHNIADHTDALGNLYFKRNDAAGSLRRYYDQLRNELRLSTHKKDAPQLERLARQSGRSTGQIKRLVSEVEGAIGNTRLPRREAARLISRLAEFRHDVQKGT